MLSHSQFVFQRGQWRPLPYEPALSSVNALWDLGYHPICGQGDEKGFHFTVYEYKKQGDLSQRWVVLFRSTYSDCSIICENWPDLIELLAKLSSIVLLDIPPAKKK